MENFVDNSDENYKGRYHFSHRSDSSSAIFVLGLLSFLFFIGFFFILMWRRSINGGVSRASRSKGAATQGLERTVIESFPLFSYSLVKGLKPQPNGSECVVCLGDFEDEEMVRLLPKCSHAFHPDCIDMWLSSHTTCPICRTSLLPADDSNPTPTDFGVVDAQTPPEQVTIIIGNGGTICRDISNEKEPYGAPERSHSSTDNSFVGAQEELEQHTE